MASQLTTYKLSVGANADKDQSFDVVSEKIKIHTASAGITVAIHATDDATANSFLIPANEVVEYTVSARRISLYNTTGAPIAVYVGVEY